MGVGETMRKCDNIRLMAGGRLEVQMNEDARRRVYQLIESMS